MKEEDCTTVMQLADFVCENMVYDEDKKIYHQKKVGDPQWIQDMIHECHYQGMLPDDFIFQWCMNFVVKFRNWMRVMILWISKFMDTYSMIFSHGFLQIWRA